VPATGKSAVGGRFAAFPGRVCAKANSRFAKEHTLRGSPLGKAIPDL
jgi:hypothetical protein